MYDLGTEGTWLLQQALFYGRLKNWGGGLHLNT